MAFFYENNLPISSNLSYAPSCLLKFSFGECQRWSKSHLYCRGERESWDFVWNPIWKGRRSWRRISVWKSNFDAPALGVRMKRFSNGQQLHICKISENLKTFKFSTTTQNLWSRHGMGCFLFFSEENLSLLVKYQYSLCSCVCWGWMQAKM